jgi:hypothetical protein
VRSGPPIDTPKSFRRNDGTKHNDQLLSRLSLGFIDTRQCGAVSLVRANRQKDWRKDLQAASWHHSANAVERICLKMSRRLSSGPG